MLRFGIYTLPTQPFGVLAERWRAAEEMGFDQLWLPDHSRHFQQPHLPWFEGFTTLAAAALATTRIRLGPLVSNPILRAPQLVAREAHALDHLSAGRLEIGIGTGIAPFDHAAMGTDPLSAGARARRFAEYVEVVDGLLRAGASGHRHDGDFFRSASPPLTPPTPQRPRPPIVIGGQAPTVLRTAARFGDVWNTHGPFGATVEQIAGITAQQNRMVDELLSTYGRAPSALRRSLLLYGPLDVWTPGGRAGDRLSRMVERFRGAGAREFVLFWPAHESLRPELERIATDVIPRMRD